LRSPSRIRRRGRAPPRGRPKAWNASGGASDNSGFLEFDEGVLVLVEHWADLGGMQVVARAQLRCVRWDGCVTLVEEVTLDKPRRRRAPGGWRFLDDNVREALGKNRSERCVPRAENVRAQQRQVA
jgi:hypothetical protein